MEHVMLDLETMSSESHAAIASLGALYFDPFSGKTGDEVYMRVDLDRQTNIRHFDGDTVLWWLKQPKEAQEGITTRGELLTPSMACDAFATFYRRGGTRLWAHGGLDHRVLGSFYNEFSLEPSKSRYGKAPWHRRQGRDIRTLNDIASMFGYPTGAEVGSIERGVRLDLTPHDALADAKRQVVYVSEMFRWLRDSHAPAAAAYQRGL